MRNNKKEYQIKIIENIEVTDAGSEGKSIAKQDGLVYFVEGAIPGDIVDVQVMRKKKNLHEPYDLNKTALYDINQIQKILPHRQPFLWPSGLWWNFPD